MILMKSNTWDHDKNITAAAWSITINSSRHHSQCHARKSAREICCQTMLNSHTQHLPFPASPLGTNNGFPFPSFQSDVNIHAMKTKSCTGLKRNTGVVVFFTHSPQSLKNILFFHKLFTILEHSNVPCTMEITLTGPWCHETTTCRSGGLSP